jgi:hypothetical protein
VHLEPVMVFRNLFERLYCKIVLGTSHYEGGRFTYFMMAPFVRAVEWP